MDMNYPRRKWQAGSSIVLLTLAVFAIFGFAALSIDVSHVYQQQREMQSATDAAALAGAALFPTNDSAGVIAVATAIAQTNGLAAAEIGTVEVGQWDTNSLSFQSGKSPYNAVRVPAQRTVGLLFGKPVGFGAMSPSVHSVAMQSFASQAIDFAPFILTTNIAYVAPGTVISFTKQDFDNSGNFGKMDVSGNWDTAMANGCSCSATNGQTESGIAGNASVGGGLQDILDTVVVMPVADSLPKNHGNFTITGFVVVELTSCGGCNGNWSVTMTVLGPAAGAGTGGRPSLTKDRILVE